LGHLVGKADVKVDPKRIEAMKYWPHPKNLKILHGFLGLTGYYRKFLRIYNKAGSGWKCAREHWIHGDWMF
jgi:hypothetical protein